MILKNHHHHHETKSTMTFEEQLQTLFSHWVSHNESHAKTYVEWAEKAETNDMGEIASLLKEVAKLTENINVKIEMAKSKLE